VSTQASDQLFEGLNGMLEKDDDAAYERQEPLNQEQSGAGVDVRMGDRDEAKDPDENEPDTKIP
jgi:hypothetical protein